MTIAIQYHHSITQPTQLIFILLDYREQEGTRHSRTNSVISAQTVCYRLFFIQGDHSSNTLKFPDISLTTHSIPVVLVLM